MKHRHVLSVMWLAWCSGAVATAGTLNFMPAEGYSSELVWSGGEAAHFAVDGGRYFLYGTQRTGGEAHNVVRMFDGMGMVEVGRSPAFAGSQYSPDAITAVNGDVYWASARGTSKTNLYRSSLVGDTWVTSTVIDESEGINMFSLSTDGSRVFGVGLDQTGTNVAFYLDDTDRYNVLAQLPGIGSGGSGFDPEGNFFAGAFGDDFAAHMYAFSADQIADRIEGTHDAPYSIADALADHVVPGNASAIMEGDGGRLFGAVFNPSFTGSDPYAFDLASGTWERLGVLAGDGLALATDLYHRDGGVYFLAKDDFGTGAAAAIYRVTPEPATGALLLLGAVAAWSRRKRPDGADRQCQVMTLTGYGEEVR
jgi:hypothetical protein